MTGNDSEFETDLADNAQAGLGAFGLGHGDGAVQFHDWRAGQARRLAVQRRDRGPVASHIGVKRGDAPCNT